MARSFVSSLCGKLLSDRRISGFVETGSYRGTTTQFFAKSNLPVASIELQARYFGYCRQRFWWRKDVRLLLGDSRTCLRDIASWQDFPRHQLFFYLDAHWNEDLPLRDELRIIFDQWPDALVVIDDFCVPDDDGYSFDDYGPGKKLDQAYLDSTGIPNLQSFYPTLPSNRELGYRRGWVASHAIRRLSSI